MIIISHTLQDGFGLDLNQRLSAALFRRASELGDAEAQGQMGLRYTLGLQDPAAWGLEGGLAFEEVRGADGVALHAGAAGPGRMGAGGGAGL